MRSGSWQPPPSARHRGRGCWWSRPLVPEAPGPHQGKTLDILMLAITGGRERTAAEYAALLELTGWKMQRVVSTPSTHSLVEATLA